MTRYLRSWTAEKHHHTYRRAPSIPAAAGPRQSKGFGASSASFSRMKGKTEEGECWQSKSM